MGILNDLIDVLKGNVKKDIKDFEDVIALDSALNRELFLGEIEDGTGSAIDTNIRFWNRQDEGIPVEERKPILLYIDSPGGNVTDTLTIINAIKMSKTPVWTIASGTAYSGGFFSFICGHRRIAYPNASFLFHEGSAGTGGTSGQFENFAAFYKKQLAQLKEIVLANTKMSEEKYKEIQREDFWMTAEEALELGVCDCIATELL